eukprot:7928073-Pyramimonas_sp.AAC.1
MSFAEGGGEPWEDERNLVVRHGCGGLMGSSEEPVAFAKIMQRPFEMWGNARPPHLSFTLKRGIFARELEGGASVIADDISDELPAP